MDKNTCAPTAPMGWNSYDYYDTAVTEADVKANADYMAAHLKTFGWEYVVVDISWYANDAATDRDRFQYIPFGDEEIDTYGRFLPSPARFPSSRDGQGFKPLASYIHSLGLKFGIHIMRGIPRRAAHEHMPVLGTDTTANFIADPSSICPWNPDMYGVRDTPEGQAYYDSIIQMYADWGVDFIKCDDICTSLLYQDDSWWGRFDGWAETRMLAQAIEKAGRPIVLSLSPGPAHIDRAWEYCKYANMWRITDDFWDDWKLLLNMFERCELWQDHVRPGCYPDCDMLPLGMLGKGFGSERRTNFSSEEARTMMTLWCMFGSPLMLGCELTKLDSATLALITDTELLDMLKPGHRGRQLERTGDYAIWENIDESTGSRKLGLFNLSDREINAGEIRPAASMGNIAVPAHGVKLVNIPA